MNEELNIKLDILLKNIEESLKDIKKSGKKAKELKMAVANSRSIVTEVLEQQLSGISLEDQINISEIPDEDWLITTRHIIDLINDPFVPINSYETYFLQLFNYLISTDKETLLNNMMFSLNKMRELYIEDYEFLVNYFTQYSFLGSFDPDNDDLTAFEARAAVLKHHSYDFLWLYRKTEDYISKRSLAAVLMNWADLQSDALMVVKSIFKDYWEPDIFPSNKDDVLVDIGAFTGDSINDYINVYGNGYKSIYAYEISKESYDTLCENMEQSGYKNITVFHKGAGSKKTKMYVKNNPVHTSANSLNKGGKKEEEVEIVRIDDDLEEIPTFIKMDIDGAEKEALRGCEETIRKHHPKLAVCIYHGYDDIWKIPSMLYEMNPDYKFYIRYNGGNLIPTEIVLLCKP